VTQRIRSAPHVHAGRVVIVQNGEVIAMGSLSNMACIGRALSTPNVDIYLHADDAQDFKAWQMAESERKRRLN
jgi:hypothetical protein